MNIIIMYMGLINKARNFKNAVILGATTLLASTLSGQEANTMAKDTIWGTGHFLVREISTNLPIENANINIKSNYIPGDTLPDTLEYNFLTNEGGWVIDAVVPQMIDIYLGTPELQDIVQNAAD